MKRLIGILMFASLLVGCAPQKRLANLLEHHPELRTGESVRTIEVDVPVEAVHRDETFFSGTRVDTITKTDTVIVYLESDAYETLRNGLTVQEGNIKATVKLTDEGLQLSIDQEADTIKQNIDVGVPQYEIEVKQKAELSGWQQFCYTLGLCSFIIIIIGIIIGILCIVLKFAI